MCIYAYYVYTYICIHTLYIRIYSILIVCIDCSILLTKRLFINDTTNETSCCLEHDERIYNIEDCNSICSNNDDIYRKSNNIYIKSSQVLKPFVNMYICMYVCMYVLFVKNLVVRQILLTGQLSTTGRPVIYRSRYHN